MSKQVSIVGAGLVGSLLGIYLAKHGYRVSIFERSADMRKQKVEAGRSINLALSDRGIKALREVGIDQEVLDLAIPMHGRKIHTADGHLPFQPYGKHGQFINSVSRRELNCRLMDLAESEGVIIKCNYKCVSINWEENKLDFETNDEAGSYKSIATDLIFGADGAYSACRLSHMLNHASFNYEQSYIDCGYKEISFPAGKNQDFLLEKNALHIWPRKYFMLIALPNTDGSFTGTLFFPMQGEFAFDQFDTAKKVNDFFSLQFPDVLPLIPDLSRQFFEHPTSTLVTVKCYPWIRNDRFCLIGDAAHAIVPFFGQGMNAGFEDCSVLNSLIEKCAHNWKKILDEFQEFRKPDADAIADLAVGNFTEMREKTADPNFLLQKKIEARLHEKYPDMWIPAYSQVTFSPDIRYSEALENTVQQEAIMQQIMSMPGITEIWEHEKLERLILDKIAKKV
jgi:kynurenine 3-monooxygenase